MSAEQVALIPQCAECRELWLPQDDDRWEAYLTDDEPAELGVLLPRVRRTRVRRQLSAEASADAHVILTVRGGARPSIGGAGGIGEPPPLEPLGWHVQEALSAPGPAGFSRSGAVPPACLELFAQVRRRGARCRLRHVCRRLIARLHVRHVEFVQSQLESGTGLADRLREVVLPTTRRACVEQADEALRFVVSVQLAVPVDQ
jgi:hypothetical protein